MASSLLYPATMGMPTDGPPAGDSSTSDLGAFNRWLCLTRLRAAAAIDIVHIPYRGGGPAVTDIIAGRIDLVALSEIALRPALDSGKGKLLATLDPVRVPNFPNVPSVVELGYPRDVYVPSVALFGPSKLSDEVVAR